MGGQILLRNGPCFAWLHRVLVIFADEILKLVFLRGSLRVGLNLGVEMLCVCLKNE